MRERNCRYRAAPSSQKRSLADPSHLNNPCSLPLDTFQQIVENLSDYEDSINLCYSFSECQNQEYCNEMLKLGLSWEEMIWNYLLTKISNILQDEELTRKVLPPGWRWDKAPSRYTQIPRRALSNLITDDEGMEAFKTIVRDFSSSVVMKRHENIPKVPGVTLEYGDYFFEDSPFPWIATTPLQMIMNLDIESNGYFMTIPNPDLRKLVMRAFRMKHCTAEPYYDEDGEELFIFVGRIPDLKAKETMMGFLLNNFPFLREDSWDILREKVDNPSLPKDFLKRIGYTVRPGVFPVAVQPGI